MGNKSNGQFYADAYQLSGSGLSVQIVAADTTLTAFRTQGASEILAQLNLHEFLVTALAGSNNDLAFIAKAPGVNSPVVRVRYVNPGAPNAALSVGVSGSDITVNLATDGSSAITTTAAQIKVAVDASVAAAALVAVALATGNDGTGVVIALAFTALAGSTGTLPTLDVSLKTTIDGSYYFSVDAFAQQNAAGKVGKKFSGVIGDTALWFLDVGGTNPVFAVSLATSTR